ncbi:pyridoxal phosphate-dependent aminotransferase [Alkalihalophilus marmarensis]|jgi:aspartate aminotransferase|uniref:Aminotransferase n=1 Tax=Alkalihalophilus marmarensis DSM 21297 TaxID=1188261 RepID=U6SPE4_9BACI|nr:pyridoxal phosphate-dependent aminotransferase [Alkalihalophilus marmarensis]ERN53589.1 aspartate aminotransferase [Alkalihalophilus marmarensis DSM 21297]MCM3490032.1 pyridoxal phosphate-dependent aminotransferase [Alkalihalophilus marmarensis]
MISQEIKQNLTQSSWIRKMFEEGQRLKAIHGADKVYDFSLGNPVIDPPKEYFEALKKYAHNPISGGHSYIPNQGLVEAREKVAGHLGDRYGDIGVSHESVIMTSGAAGALNVALRSILNEDDEVIIFTPFFVEYKFYVNNAKGKAVYVPLAEDFTIDLEKLAEHITDRTKAVILNNPHNPTGQLLTQEDLEAFNRLLREKETEHEAMIYVLYDDPYSQLIYDYDAPNPFKAIDRLFYVSSFSKDLGLAGERLGYLAIDSRMEDAGEYMAAFVFANRTLGFGNASVTVQRMISQLPTLTQEQAGYKERRNAMVEVLTDAGFDFVEPKGGFFIFPKSPLADDTAFCKLAAEKFNILLVPGSGFGREGHFRLSYSVSLEQIENSKEAFKALLQECKAMNQK